MINILNDGKYFKLEWYTKNGYNSKLCKKFTLVPVRRVNKNYDVVKKVNNVSNNKEYSVIRTENNISHNLTIPYKINTDKSGKYYYDYQLGTKLLEFGDIVSNDSKFNNDLVFPKYLYYDIETTGLSAENGIISNIVFIDKDDNVKVFTNDDGDEKRMLLEVYEYLKANNVLSLIGFNSKAFDDEFLRYRMNVNQIPFNPVMSCNIDVMKMCNKLFINGSLSSIAKQLGVIEKIELESNPVKLFYDGDFDTLIEYNIRDVEVTKAICDKMSILPFVEALWRLSWCDFRNLNANSRLLDCYFNKKMWNDNVMVSNVDLKYKGSFSGGLNVFFDGEKYI